MSNQQYKLVICGLYFHINAVLNLPEERVKITGIADHKYGFDNIFHNPNIDPERIARDRNIPLYQDWLEMLDREDPDIVAVYCVDSEKKSIIVESLKRGRHVVSDKPLCTNLDHLVEIEAALAGSSGSLALLLPFPYQPIFKKIKEIISTDRIGDVLSVRSRRAYLQKTAARPKWFFTKQHGGGLLCDIGTHEFDLIRFLTGKEALEVTAYALNGKIKQFGSGEDYAHALFKMTDQAIYSLHLDRISALNSVGEQSSMEIIGTKGQIVIPIGYEKMMVTIEGEKGPREDNDFAKTSIYDELMKDYMDSLENDNYGKPFFAPQVFKSVRAVLSAQKSADLNGVKIKI